jgi:Tfp pilus assembly protein PilF
MAQDLIANLEALLATGQDAPSLRFALASRYLAAGDTAAALRHAQAAVALDATYSAGWKVLAQARAAAGDERGAMEGYRRGIEVADARGDRQAAKEMTVFLRRLEKRASSKPPEGGGA